MSEDRRFRLALPNKGRLSETSVRLLRDAGLSFDQTDRSLSVSVRNAAIDLLFVRTEDVVELVADGVADLGITGLDVAAEDRRDLDVVLDLGFGRCELTLAVPSELDLDKPEQFAGMRIATSHPNLTRSFFDGRGIDVDVIRLRGSVEVAPKLGVADAIVDLVSTGSTLMVNGLKPVMPILASQAVLIANPTAETSAPEREQVITAVRSVSAARTQRYLLMNAPIDAVEAIVTLVPGMESPTVIPLAEAGMVAIHSVVAADDVWSLLPDLKRIGAQDILVNPIGQLVP